MIDVENYAGREQSYIKHQFLNQYLQQAAFKTLQGRSPVFNFVDAFAGPWSVSDKDDYSDASFDQAIRTLETVRTTLGRMGIAGLKIRFCFCEKRRTAFEELRQYSESQKRFDINVFHGSFEDNLDAIAKVCSDGFTFSFIDPTGWDIDSQKIFHFLKKLNGEALINFMSSDINRFPNFEKVADAYGRLLADLSWKDDFVSLSSDWSNEERILQLFKAKMKASGAATFTPDIVIQDRLKDRIKMRLVLATFSNKGLELFRDVQEKVEKQEMSLRSKTKRHGQNSLFNDDIFAQMQQDAFGVGCGANKNKAEIATCIILQKSGEMRFQALSDILIERYPLRAKHVRAIVKAMKVKGLISYDLPPKKKLAQPDTLISLSK